jgi:hypothetical protein
MTPLSEDAEITLRWLNDREEGRAPMVSARYAVPLQQVSDLSRVATELLLAGYMERCLGKWCPTAIGRAYLRMANSVGGAGPTT